MVKISQTNSSVVCGKLICKILDLTNIQTCYMKNYKKKLFTMLANHTHMIIKILMNIYSITKDTGKLVMAAKIRVTKKMTEEKIVVLKLLTQLLRNDYTFRLGVMDQISESPVDVLVTWFFDF